MPVGKVKWFDPKKGYGFIIGEEGQDVFVHFTSIAGTGFRALKDGEEVSYEMVKGEKGLQARNVLRPGQEAASPTKAPPAPIQQPAAAQQPAAG